MSYTHTTLEYFHKCEYAIANDSACDGFISASAGLIDNGDSVQLFVRFESNKMIELRYRIRAGVATMACTEFLAQHCQQMTLEQAALVTSDFILSALQLPKTRINSALLPLNALNKAIQQYKEVNCGSTQT